MEKEKKKKSNMKKSNIKVNEKTQNNSNNVNIIPKEEVKERKEFLDVTFSCDYLYQLLYDNKTIKPSLMKWALAIIILTYIITNILIFHFVVIVRLPTNAYSYKCFDIETRSYGMCTTRDLCICESSNLCVNPCYDNLLTCSHIYLQNNSNYKFKQHITLTYGKKYNVYFENNNKVSTLFHNPDNYCDMKGLSIILALFFFGGGVFGSVIFGMLADRYGRCKIIFINFIILIISLLFLCIKSDFDLQNESILFFMTIASIQGFLLGSTVFPLQSNVYIYFMEFYPDIAGIPSINAFIFSSFAVSYTVVIIYFRYSDHFRTMYYFAEAFIVSLFVLFFIIIKLKESPRYFAEKKDFLNKTAAFSRIVTRIIVERKNENDEKIKEPKVTLFYYPTTHFIQNDQIMEKKKDSRDQEDFDENIAEEKNSGDPSNAMSKRGDFNEHSYLNQPSLLRKKRNQKLNSMKTKEYSQDNSIGIRLDEKSKEEDNDIKLKETTIIRDEINKNNNKDKEKEKDKGKTKKDTKLRKVKLSGQKLEKMMTPQSTFIEKEEYSIKFIFKTLWEDESFMRNSQIFVWLWIIITYTFLGLTLNLMYDILDPNKYKGSDLDLLLILLGSIIIVPFLTFLRNVGMSIEMIFSLCLFSIFILTFWADYSNVFPDADTVYYFGISKQQAASDLKTYQRYFAMIFGLTAYALLNLITITNCLTAYRNTSFGILRAVSIGFFFASFCSNLILDNNIMTISILTGLSFLIFFTINVKFNELKIKEFIDLNTNTKTNKAKSNIQIGKMKHYESNMLPIMRSLHLG